MLDKKKTRIDELIALEKKLIELAQQLQESIPLDGLDNLSSEDYDHFVKLKLELRNSAFSFYQKARYEKDWCFKGLHYLSLAFHMEHRKAVSMMTESLRVENNERVSTNLPKGLDYYQYYLMGLSYLTGLGSPQNHKMAIKALSLASTMGCAEARYLLGICFENGYSVTKGNRTAFNLFLRAAEQGNGCAQYVLGTYYYKGKGCFKNFKKGFSWQLKAAKQGHANAQVWIGVHYGRGEGCSKNYKKTFKWTLKAVKLESGLAQNELGNCYLRGIGVDKSNQQSARMFRLAGENHEPTGFKNLKTLGDCDYFNYHLAMSQTDVKKVVKLLLANKALTEELSWDRERAKNDKKLQALIDKVDKKLAESLEEKPVENKKNNSSGKVAKVGVFSKAVRIEIDDDSYFHIDRDKNFQVRMKIF